MITIDGSLGDRTVQVALEGEELEFVMAHDDFGDVMRSYKWAMDEGLWSIGKNGRGSKEEVQETEDEKDLPQGISVMGIAVSNYQVVSRIKAWNGIHLANGDLAPCTEENKLLFFGKYPGVLFKIMRELGRREEAERKNSETSQAG